MTDRLYLQDAYRREFEARVTSARVDGGRAVVELDRTAFYPTSGGQLHDTGVIDEGRVTEVVDEAGRILHRLAPGVAPEGLLGRTVTGRIDWARRFDHMQQHTGQHVLSQAALRALGAATLAVHLGVERCTLDLDHAAFGVDEAERIEEAANAIVMDNRPVTVRFVEEHALGDLGLRRPSKKRGTIRVVEIDGFDRSACGGTHVRATGEIGTIAVVGWERYKGGVRVEFLCGWRAVRDGRQQRRVLAAVGRLLSARTAEVQDAVERLQTRERETERREGEARQRLLAAEADQRRRAIVLPGVHAEIVADRTIEEVRGLAAALAHGGGLIVLLGADEGRVVFARSADVAVDVAALLRRATERFGGRGGGKPEFAQGTVSGSRPLAEVLGAVRRWAEEALAGA